MLRTTPLFQAITTAPLFFMALNVINAAGRAGGNVFIDSPPSVSTYWWVPIYTATTEPTLAVQVRVVRAVLGGRKGGDMGSPMSWGRGVGGIKTSRLS